MPKGRCAGCGLENGSAKLIERHITKCPDYLDLYKKDPAKALSAEEEASRYDALKKTDAFIEEREAAKDERYDGYRAAAAKKVEALRERWRGGTKFKALNRKSAPTVAPEGATVWGLTPEESLAKADAGTDIPSLVAAERLVGLIGIEK